MEKGELIGRDFIQTEDERVFVDVLMAFRHVKPEIYTSTRPIDDLNQISHADTSVFQQWNAKPGYVLAAKL